MSAKNVFLFILLFAIGVFAQERFVRPVDEAAQDASFLAFRKKLIEATEKKDWQFVYSIVDRKSNTSFGNDTGFAAFKGRYDLRDKNSTFWKEFPTVIKNGGAFVGEGRNRMNLFNAPYTFSSWPDDLDSFENHVIFGENVNLRKEPAANSEIVARLSYNIVKIEPETLPKSGRSEYPGWWKVATLGGLKGFVKSEFVRSPIDYRAGFEKKRGVWKMIFFIAGD